MPPDGDDKGAFAADIPPDAIAQAVAAVERRAAQVAARASPAEEERPTEAGAGETPVVASGALPETERLRLELEMSQQRSRQVFEQLKDEHDRLLRTAADLENTRKRAAREKEDVQRFGNERLVKELLPAIDNLERALGAAAADDPLAVGVGLTHRLLLDALARFGVSGFTAVGLPFDPRLHEALMTVATGEHPPGMVLEEQQRGFLLHDRLLRPAAVVVSAAAPAAAPGPEPLTPPDDEGHP